MVNLTNKELKHISGGSLGVALAIGAGIVFLVGVFDGYVRPLKCR